MLYQVRVDDGETSIVVEAFDDLGQAIDCYVLQILALNQPFVDIQIVQMIGDDDDEFVQISSQYFTGLFSGEAETTSGVLGKRLGLLVGAQELDNTDKIRDDCITR